MILDKTYLTEIKGLTGNRVFVFLLAIAFSLD